MCAAITIIVLKIIMNVQPKHKPINLKSRARMRATRTQLQRAIN